MDIRVDHESFERRRLSVRPGTFFRSPALLVDGEPVAKKRGRHSVVDDENAEREVRLRTSAFDPLPRVEIEGLRIAIAPPLKPYEVALALLPVLLIVVGGALGGAIGLTAAYANFVVLRGAGGKASRYAAAIVITGLAAGAWFAASIAMTAWLAERFPHIVESGHAWW